MTATISKGTLNLRFMQKSQRAEQELEIESVETTTNDESRWEVAREVRDMWGITSEESSSSLVTHEASYLPFILSHSDASGSPPQPIKLRGRRTWNKRGQEVAEVEIRFQPLPPVDESRGLSSARQDPPTSKRLTSISSLGSGSATTKQAKRSESRSTKTAREIIREAPLLPSGIGIIREIRIKTKTEEDGGGDTPAPPRPSPLPPSSAPSPKPIEEIYRASPAKTPKFLKPAGVEEPSDSVARRRDRSRLTQLREEATGDTSHGQGNGTRRPKLKRERDDHSEAGAPAAADDNKPKRKKSGAAAAAA